MTPEEFREAGHRVVDWIADYRAGLAGRRVGSSVEPGEILDRLPSSPPAGPEPFARIIEDLETVILPGLCLWQHPQFFGYFPSNGSLASVLGDFLSTGLGVLGLSWQSSPALTELETCVVDWMRQLCGLSGDWQGVIQDTASTSTLVALLCARERTSRFCAERGGLQGEAAPLVVYTSAQSHSSVDKAALLAGFGRDNIRRVACDAGFAMDPGDLARQVQADIAAGRVPCAIVATVGTTATTAIDPLAEIGAVARTHGLWLHVDAAMAGSAMILPECRWMWEGIESADSLVINAHKWLGAAFDCSLYYVRDPALLVRVMSTSPSYLQSAADDRVKNYRDWGIPLGRRFRALKLWCLLRVEGAENLKQRLRRDLDNARWLAAQVDSTPDWNLIAPARLQTVCIRHEPSALQPDELDAHTQEWVAAVNRSGRAWLTPAQVDGRWICRVSVGAELTEHQHVAALWRIVQEEAASSAARWSRSPA